MPWCCCMFWVDLHSTLHVLILLLEHQNCLWLMVLMFSQVVVLCCRLHFIVYGPVRTKLLAATLSLLLDYWCHGWMLFSSLLDVLPRSYVLYHCQVLLHLFDELLLPFLLLHVSADTLLLLLHLYALVVHYSQVSLAYLRNNLIIFDSLVRAVCFCRFPEFTINIPIVLSDYNRSSPIQCIMPLSLQQVMPSIMTIVAGLLDAVTVAVQISPYPSLVFLSKRHVIDYL